MHFLSQNVPTITCHDWVSQRPDDLRKIDKLEKKLKVPRSHQAANADDNLASMEKSVERAKKLEGALAEAQ
eukprot:scaffold289155_cov41-Prasinocladus_malaysianus.AAC.1